MQRILLGDAPQCPQRRTFIKFAGFSLATVAATAVCPRLLVAQTAGGAVDLGRGDTAVLNYAYMLEQLEAEFYRRVTSQLYQGCSLEERTLLEEISEHEVAHREFFHRTLGGSAIPDLQFDFSRVDFRSRQSVLESARHFEDIGVGAYNGAGQLLRDPAHLLAAGRIVSVEARHAATLRDLLAPRTAAFAGSDVVDAFGLGAVSPPALVMEAVRPFIQTSITASGLPRA